MQKFTEFVKEHKASIALQSKATIANKFNQLYEAKLKELGALSPLDLSDRDSRLFFDYLKSLNEEDLNKADIKKIVKSQTKDLEKKVKDAEDVAKSAVKDAEKAKEKAGKGEIKTEADFREYAEAVLRKAHPKDYDEKLANKIMDDLIKQVKDNDWGPAIGKLNH